MDEERAQTKIPRYWRGVAKARKSKGEKLILATFDTETCKGQVFATGFYSPTLGKDVKILHGLKKDHFSWLLDNCFSLAAGHRGRVIVSAHYLVFDISVLLYPICNPQGVITATSAPRSAHFSLLKCRTEVKAVFSKPCFVILKRGKESVTIIDTYSFFIMGLAKALIMVGSETKKLPKPHDLGERVIPLPELRPYLNNDCLGGYALLEELARLHASYETKFCLSLPMLSGSIFRSHYLKKNFEEPSGPLRRAAMLSYHGGKNAYPPKTARLWPGCYDLDINSAYPEAMRQLPDFENGVWRILKGSKLCLSHPHGIYRVTGVLAPCPWGVLFDHEFKKAQGRIVGTWVTGYELIEAVRSGELEIESVTGYAFIESFPNRKPRPGQQKSTAFSAFVDHFYMMKEQATTPTARFFYKLILNSLYGKFVARIKDINDIWVAGSMFDPALASLITGFVRAKVHRLEHKYKALHTATDGFITQMEPDPADISPALGKLKKVNYGPCLIFRNKLYLHYDEAGNLKKYALHGFQEGPEALRKMWDTKNRSYKIKRLTRWSESWHTGNRPGLAIESDRILSVPI